MCNETLYWFTAVWSKEVNLWGIFGRLYLGNNKLEKESNKICFIADVCQEKKRDVSWEKRPNKNFVHWWGGGIMQQRLRTVNDLLLFTLESLGRSKMPGSISVHGNLGTNVAGV